MKNLPGAQLSPEQSRSARLHKAKRPRNAEMWKKPAVYWSLEKQVHPDVPDNPDHRGQLWEDPRRMGCEALLDVPSDIQDEKVLQEIGTRRVPQEFRKHNLRSRPKLWEKAH